jgi:hypothetical protein
MIPYMRTELHSLMGLITKNQSMLSYKGRLFSASLGDYSHLSSFPLCKVFKLPRQSFYFLRNGTLIGRPCGLYLNHVLQRPGLGGQIHLGE